MGQRSEGSPARIHDHQLGSRADRLLEDRHQVDAGGGGVGAPENDQARMDEIVQRDSWHSSVQSLGGEAGGSGADGPSEPGGSQPEEEPGVGGVLGKQTVGPS